MSKRYALIAAIRNEGPFLLEWTAYHRMIGFTDIHVFSADDTDGNRALLGALADAGALTAHVNAGPGGHRNRAYEQAFRLPAVQAADYVMALDTDEFVNIHVGDGTLSALMDATRNPDAISLCWRMFGHGGHLQYDDVPVTARFTRAAPTDVAVCAPQFAVKTLFRPGLATGIGPHRPAVAADVSAHAVRWVNGAGKSVSGALLAGGWKLTATTAGYDLAQINHYVVRSAAIFALHNVSRPMLGSEPVPLGLPDFLRLNHNQAQDTTILRHADALATAMEALHAAPGVAAAHAATVARTRALLADLLDGGGGDPGTPLAQIMDADAARALVRAQQGTPDDPAEPEDASPAPGQVVADAADLAPRWLADLRRSDHRRGWYVSHDTFAVQFTRRSSDVLVVSFDNLSSVNDASLARDTWGYPFYAAEGWSHMGVMAFEKHWFRDTALFDALEDQRSLFAQFRTVVMTGTSMGAYAATAFADLAPGCTVLAYSPQATLDATRVPWEDRFGSGRKQDWSGRYAFAPDHCRSARDVFVVYDPYFGPDRQHAMLYRGDNVHHLQSWYTSHKSALFMRRADILKDLMREAAAGTLTPARYYALYRQRRDLPWYVNGLADHLIARGHAPLALRLADHLEATVRPRLAQGIRARVAS
ncbi:Glycosyl transferase family 2 [Loktanella fryxellensis]|uniref:Glycosyl transferase family 2 n=1 Tax=Loktanella fryxellensis TaxID=245187 RepID=A0A1H8H321_9RHOB|nr:glycosyltransferase family 2 protein [Loktanella fryxellensis]SEN50374.1 Glycosyl transferase family 2 [Loktanella fryxellensis]